MRRIPSLKRAWSGSTLVRVGVVLSLVSLLALTVIVVATVFADRSTGKASAINVAGSLRMQSFALATRIAEPVPQAEDGRAAVAAAIAGFEQRLAHPALLDSVNSGAPSVRADYEAVERAWRSTLRPLAEAAPTDPAARADYLRRVGAFVQQIDEFVQHLESNLEAHIQWLRIVLGVGFFGLLMLVAAILLLLNIEVFHPVARLVEAARRVQAGDFSVRASATGADEIGQLGQSFNMMVQELGQLTANLERQVQERTHDLERRNRSLALLYETTRTLSAGPVDPAALRHVLEIVHQLLPIEAGALSPLRSLAGAAPLVQVGTLLLEEIVPDDAPGATAPRLAMRVGAGPTGDRRLVSVPLVDAGLLYGHMHLALPTGKALEQWQLDLTETIGRHIGAALANAERSEEHRRLGVLEERGAMARELHDSLAQALAYTQIQAARLAATLRVEGHGAASQRVLEELREGLGSAYRQLRELLATFRLQLGGQGLGPALRETLADFERRSSVAALLDDRIGDVELGINEQVHVLQIVREALTNVEHHARAQHAAVRLLEGADQRIEVTVEDDGVGIAACEPPRGHFGLTIMCDRAQLLGGELAVTRRAAPAAGTCVRLSFPRVRRAPATRVPAGQAA